MIKRIIKDKIIAALPLKEIVIITGARQVGKTTILKEIIEELKKKEKNVLYLNLDIEEDSNHFQSQQKLLNKIELEVGKEEAYIFIDEIQQKENAGKFLKGIYDMDLPYKFVVTGSGSLELKEKISEALTGRKYLIEMSPVDFSEFVNYKTHYKYDNRLDLFFKIEQERTELLLNEYLSFGGYPAVVTAETVQRKQEIMSEIFVSYITKDISFLLEVRQPDKFIKLIQLLAVQSGTLINLSQLAQDSGIRIETLKTYLWYAEQTYIIKIIRPYYTNLKKEITKSPCIYFNDLGMLNFSKGNNFSKANNGMLYQNFVFLILKEQYAKGLRKINYWRTKDKAEVDFIIHTENGIVPVEVKQKKLKKPTVTRSFRSFILKYKPTIGFIVNNELDETVMINETRVIFIPFWNLFNFSKANLHL